MSLRYWKGENECSGKTSIYRGPLLLAIVGEGKEIDDIVLDANMLNELANVKNINLLQSQVIVEIPLDESTIRLQDYGTAGEGGVHY